MPTATQTTRRAAIERGLLLIQAEREERGRIFVGGHQPGYQQNRGPGGKFGPGNGPEEEGGGGEGRGDGEAKGGGGSARGAGGGSTRGGGIGKGAGSVKDQIAATKQQLDAAKAQAKAQRAQARQAKLDAKASAKGTAEAEGLIAKGGGTKGGKAPKETVHEKAARLQREQGLKPEVQAATGKDAFKQRLEPVGNMDEKAIDPYGPPSVGGLRELYGEHQLGAALSRYSPERLREAAKAEGVSEAGSKEALVSRITAHATEGRYSADFKASKAAGKAAEKTARAEQVKARAEAKAAKAEAAARAPKATKAPRAPVTKAQKDAKVKAAQRKVDDAQKRYDAGHQAFQRGVSNYASVEDQSGFYGWIHGGHARASADLTAAQKGLARAQALPTSESSDDGGDSSGNDFATMAAVSTVLRERRRRMARRWMAAADLSRVVLDEGADGFHRSWIMLFPEGEYDHSQYGKLDFSRKTLSEIKDNFDHGAREIEIAIDRDHKASEDDSRAMGWIERLELREGMRNGDGEAPAGLWALVRWTPLGLKDVQDQVYRYFSPEYKPEYTNQLTGKKYRNVLIGGALTNRPFLKAMSALQLADGGGGMDVSRKPWGQVDKDCLPRSAFLDQGDPAHPSTWRLPVYEGVGAKDANGRYTKRGPLNINGVRAAIAALHGARSGEPMTGLPAGVAAKLQRWWDRYGGSADDSSSDSESESRAARERMPARRTGQRTRVSSSSSREAKATMGTMRGAPRDDERLLDDELDDGGETFDDMPEDGEGYDDAEDAADGGADDAEEGDDGFDTESDTHGPMTVKAHSHGKYGRHAHSDDGDHSEAPVKMSAKMSAKAGSRKASERGDGEVRALREELAQVRFQLYEKAVDATIEGWGKQTFQFKESAKAAPKSGRIALSRAFREQYRAFMLNEAVRLSEGQRDKLNALIEGALSTAIVDLSSRGSSFDQESRRTRRGGEPVGGAADSDRLQQRAEQLAQEQGISLMDADPAKVYALYERASREIGYGARH